MSVQIDRLQEQLRGLKLPRIAEELPILLQEASQKETSYADFLEDITTRELQAKKERTMTMKTTMARFPFHKTLESFDFKFSLRSSRRWSTSSPPAASSPTPTTCCCSGLLASARRTWRWLLA